MADRAQAAERAFLAVFRGERARPLGARFASERARAQRWTIEAAGLRFDFSKTHWSAASQKAALAWLKALDMPAAIRALLTGAEVNPTEGRAALHTAFRARPPRTDFAGHPVAAAVADIDAGMRRLVQTWRASGMRHVLHIGIGGSALGPDLALSALTPRTGARFDVRVLANVDGEAFERAILGVDPKKTLVIVASKSWTTLETQRNAQLVLDWMASARVARPRERVIALTGKPDRAIAWGVKPEHVLDVPDWVGGRYSLWSAIGLPVALQLGWEGFTALRRGAGAMDAHLARAPLAGNAPLLGALIGFGYAQAWGARSRAVFAYDERLRLLPAHLAQVELESLGKRIGLDGRARRQTAPVLWGGTGTDAQHAVFQLLHQGTELVPVDFIGVRTPEHDHGEAHRALMANMLAQAAALMAGDRPPAARGPAGLLARHKTFPGDRPSITILADALTPAALGALIAYYEHRTYLQGVLWDINPFDQMGVELGKVIAQSIEPTLAGEAVERPLDPSTRALIDWLKR